jgi:hypothetical protein
VYQYRYLQAEIPDTDFPVLATGLVQRFYINVWTGFLLPCKNIEARLENARCRKYALMGFGFHDTNGIDAVTSYKIYHTYVLPRLIYGLEVLPLKKKHVENLESFHRK